MSLFSQMNDGLPDTRRPGAVLQRTDFFLGGVVTNHKRYEREVMPQYFKLRKKARAGARFVISQAGWNTRKDDELLRWIRREQLDLYALANVYLLSRTAARAFRRGIIPGIVVTEELLALAERHGSSPDRGRAFFVDLASKHLAVVRGLGYDGVYLGGHMSAETFGEIIDRAQGLAGDWRELAREIQFAGRDEFHLFERDEETGLSSDVVDATYLGSKRRRRTDLRVPVRYRLSRRLHETVFAREAPLFATGRRVYRRLEQAPRPVRRAAHAVEQAAKVPLFACKDCGDCSLPEIAYVCPESQCAKNQRNGPCGGTRDGLCEVYDTECIWSEAYERLKAYGEEESMLDGPVVVKDNALQGTSAWANTFLGRDHLARASPTTGAESSTAS
jgi:methylenetetrahydrofolate reductase (NADPH)